MEDSAPAPRRVHELLLGLGLAFLTAVTGWLLGHLPWVVSGFSWPTRHAARVGSSSEGLAGVRLAIPLVVQWLPSLVAFTLVGAVSATLLPLLLTTHESRRRLPAVGISVVALLVTIAVVTVLARDSIEAHAAGAFAGDRRVLLGLVLVVAATTLVGATFGALASVQVGFLPLAVALVAGQVPPWLDAFLVGHHHGPAAFRVVDRAADLLALGLLVVAFTLSVRRSAAWALLWPVAVALLWVATPFRVATTYLADRLRPSAGLPGSLPDILAGAVDVFRASFWHAPQARWPWVLAVLLAVGLLVVERSILRSRR